MPYKDLIQEKFLKDRGDHSEDMARLGKEMNRPGNWLIKKGKVLGDEDKAKKLSLKLGLSDERSEKIADATGNVTSKVREFAGEHGGKVAAGVAAGLGALGLAKLLRRKKNKDAESAA